MGSITFIDNRSKLYNHLYSEIHNNSIQFNSILIQYKRLHKEEKTNHTTTGQIKQLNFQSRPDISAGSNRHKPTGSSEDNLQRKMLPPECKSNFGGSSILKKMGHVWYTQKFPNKSLSPVYLNLPRRNNIKPSEKTYH